MVLPGHVSVPHSTVMPMVSQQSALGPIKESLNPARCREGLTMPRWAINSTPLLRYNSVT